MEPVSVHGDAFSEYYLRKLLPQEPRLLPRLDPSGADREFRRVASLLRDAHRELRGSRQACVTKRALFDPLAGMLGWNLGKAGVAETGEGEEDAGLPLLASSDGSRPLARVRVLPYDASLDLPLEGLHRRFAPAAALVRVLEREGLTWGLLLTAYELRVVRRSEGFVASHLAFSLYDIAGGETEAGREGWRLLWGLLRGGAWEPAPSVLDEVVRLGREHQQEVGARLGTQVPAAIERLLQGILDRPENRARLRPLLEDPGSRRRLLDHLYAGALRVLYRILFTLYAEARGLLPLDLPTYRDGYALTGSGGLVRRALDPRTDPRAREPEAGFFETSLRGLFALLREGADLGPEGRIPAYGGGLFHDGGSPDGLPSIDELRFGDGTVAWVLQFLTRVETRAGLVALSYRELDVEQLGALYEGLLEREVDYVDSATGRLWRIRLDGDVVLVTDPQRADLRARRGEIDDSAPEEPDDEEDDEEEPEGNGEEEDDDVPSTRRGRPILVLAPEEGMPNPIPAGSVVLRPGLRRKQSGSYYTNRAFVDFLVRRALDPLAEGKRPEEILALKVCDLAMGSGHFLVGACRRLSEHLLAAYRARVEEERRRASANGGEPPLSDLLVEAGVHPEVARHWRDEPRELAACRLLVAGNCIYGVDKNPLAVELARVSLWLATAAADQPLTFLDHRLVEGDSLLGLPVEELLRPFEPPKKGRSKKTSPTLASTHDGAAGLFDPPRREMEERLRRAFGHLELIRELVEEHPGDFAGQRAAYEAMQGELRHFLDLHRLRAGRAFLPEGHPAASAELPEEWLQQIGRTGYVDDDARAAAEEAIRKAREMRAFSWELAFPEVFHEPDETGQRVRRRDRPGFDALIGNPPWDKVKPAKKEFFARYDPAIRDFQGQTLNRRIGEIAPDGSEAARLWREHEAREKLYAQTLLKGGIFRHQIAEVRGEKTGGDPDLFKFFLERNHQLAREGGRVAMLVKGSLYIVEGSTGLRRLLFEASRVESLFSFENWGKRFFDIHASEKFITLVFAKESVAEQSFPAAFMLRDERFLALPTAEQQARAVRIAGDFIRLTSPDYLALVEVRNAREKALVERIYRAIPPLGRKIEDTWNVSFTRELDMTNDSWLFRRQDWLSAHACALFTGGRKIEGPDDACFPQAPPGGQFWMTPEEAWYEARPERFVRGKRYVTKDGSRIRITLSPPAGGTSKGRSRGPGVLVLDGFVLAGAKDDPHELPVRPGARYVPLYEGRMVQQFDHAAKAYESGEGRSAKWRWLDFSEKMLVPHFFVESTLEGAGTGGFGPRAGFCDTTGQTNERSALPALLPGLPAGNTVPTVTIAGGVLEAHLCWVAVACSLVADYLLRQKITSHLNFFYFDDWPFPRVRPDDPRARDLASHAARLSCTTPELADIWNDLAGRLPNLAAPWSEALLREASADGLLRPTIDLRERARLRAEIDAIVADLYGLSVAEFGHVLTTFPLLDREQPPLPDDVYVRWNKQGKRREEPRSYVTRDLALLAYMRKKGVEPPADLVAWFRDEVGLDMEDPACPFKMGPIRALDERVEEARRRGAIAYVPSRAKKWEPNGPYQPLAGSATEPSSVTAGGP